MSDPSAEARSAAIVGVFDRAATTYDQVGVDFFGPVAEALVARTAPRPGERVLDLGCGRGASALRAAVAVGPTGVVTATDLAPAMVRALREQAADLPWLTASIGDAALPPPGPWDVIEASLVLFFLPDLATALDRYRDALSPTGRLGVTWFGEADESWEAELGSIVGGIPEGSRPLGNIAKQGAFESVEALEGLLAARGFGDVTTTQQRIHLEFGDPEQWWDWMWSQGQRSLLELHEANGSLDLVLEQVQPMLEERARQGRLSWWTDIRVTLARV